MRRTWLLLACLLIPAESRAQALIHPVPAPTDRASAATDTPALPAGVANVPVFRAAVDLVALNVVVTDAQQKFVSGLSQQDFAVFEDGVEQEVSFFATSDVPLDLALLLDTSASMSDKMQTMQQAAVGFASTLRSADRAMIVDIKDASRVLLPLSANVSGAVEAIRSTAARGGTALYNGLYLTLKEFVADRRHTTDVRHQAIVVFSDGDDTASLVSFDDVLDVAKQSGIAVYTITLKSRYDVQRASALTGNRYFSQSEYAMKALATETGARAFFPTEITELAGVYASIAEELATEYAIGYTSNNPKRDGAFRRVMVRVSDRPSARTRTRSGYQATRTQPSLPVR